MMINNNHADILSQLDAMRVQEATTMCFNYFERNSDCIDEVCRKSMVTWIQQVQKTLGISPETVWIAVSFFDRYLSSGKGNSRGVLGSKCKFQLAAITAFYTAVKIYEPVVLSIDMLIMICRDTYTEADIVSMEKDILTALEWRVSCYTPMDFARSLLQLLNDEDVSSDVSDSLLKACQMHLDIAVTDMHLSCRTPASSLGTSCLASSLTHSDILSLSEKQSIWGQLTEFCGFDLSSREVIAAQQCLLSHSSPCKPNDASKYNSLLQQSNITRSASSTSSPICVSKTARQA